MNGHVKVTGVTETRLICLIVLEKLNFISSHHSDFQSGDSTVDQLSYLYHEFPKPLDEKKDVHIVFL